MGCGGPGGKMSFDAFRPLVDAGDALLDAGKPFKNLCRFAHSLPPYVASGKLNLALSTA